MNTLIIVFLLIFIVQAKLTKAQIDFKYDDEVYKTIYPEDLLEFMSNNPGAILIDVRSIGEFADTSGTSRLNIGRLKGSINIPIESVENRLQELKDRSDKPIVLYCSHSQRSRRVGKLLAGNGFKNVWNLNGGMTYLNQCSTVEFPGKKDLIEYSVPYKNLPPEDAVQLILGTKDLLIIDVRSAAEFEGTDTIESRNIGRIKNAVNIPADKIEQNLSKIDKSKVILVYDSQGSQSNPAAKYLTEKGYSNVNHIIGGLSALIGRDYETLDIRNKILENTPPYNILNVAEAVSLIEKEKDAVILDIRPAEEFNNKAEMEWHNLGHINNAINIQPPEFDAKITELANHKKDAIIVYGSDDAANFCLELSKSGFENVNLSYGGMWNFVAAAFNAKDLKRIKLLLTDHEGLY